MARAIKFPKHFHVTKIDIKKGIEEDIEAFSRIQQYNLDIDIVAEVLELINYASLTNDEETILKYFEMKKELPKLIKQYKKTCRYTEEIILPFKGSYVEELCRGMLLPSNLEDFVKKMKDIIKRLDSMSKEQLSWLNDMQKDLLYLRKYDETHRIIRVIKNLSSYFYAKGITKISEITTLLQVFITHAIPKGKELDADNIKKLIVRNNIMKKIRLEMKLREKLDKSDYYGEALLIEYLKRNFGNLRREFY